MPAKILHSYINHFLEISPYLPEETIRRYQFLKLRALTNYAAKNFKFYHSFYRGVKLPIESWVDFENLPILRREDIQKNFPHGFELPGHHWRKTERTTSGSTAAPLKMWADQAFKFWRTAMKRRLLKRAGTDLREHIVHLRLGLFGQEPPPHILFIPCLELQERKQEFYKMIKEFKARTIFAFSSSLYDLARFSRDDGVKIKFEAAFTFADTLNDEMRKFTQEQFGCEIFNCYGLNEIGFVAEECQNHVGLHCNDEACYVEVVDGKIVVTNFLNEVMPFIRYETGDLGYFLPDECSCGRTSRLIIIDGRQAEKLAFSNGKTVHYSIFHSKLHRYFPRVLKWQIVQKTETSAALKIVAGSSFSNETEKELLKSIGEVLGVGVKLRIQLVNAIPPSKNGKHRPVVPLPMTS